MSGTGTLFDVASQSRGHTYLDVVNIGSAAATTTVTISGVGGATGGTATVLRGDPAAQNTLARPSRVAPATTSLGKLGSRFRYTFPADSLTVLDLSTAGPVSTAARSSRPPAGVATTSVGVIARRAIADGEASRQTAKVTRRPAAGLRGAAQRAPVDPTPARVGSR